MDYSPPPINLQAPVSPATRDALNALKGLLGCNNLGQVIDKIVPPALDHALAQRYAERREAQALEVSA